MADNGDVHVGGNSILVLASMGTGAFLALLTMLFVLPCASGEFSQTNGQYFAQRIAMAAAFLVSSAALPAISNLRFGGRRSSCRMDTLKKDNRHFDMLSKSGIIIGFGFIIMVIWVGDALDGSTNEMLMLLACVLAGVAAALNARIWLLFYTRAFFQLSRLSVFWSICMAVAIAGAPGLAGLGFDFFSVASSRAFLCTVLALISIFTSYYCRNDLSPVEDADFLSYSRHWSDRMSSLLKVARPLYAGFALAITMQLLLNMEGFPISFPLFSCALILSALAYAMVTWVLKGFIPIPTVDRLACGFICVCFLVLPFADRLASLLILAVLLLACLFFFVQTWCTVIQMMTYWSSSSLPDRGVYSLSSAAGFFVGYALMTVLFECVHLPFDSVTAFSCIIIVVLFVLLCTFIPYDNPIWDEFSNIVNGIDGISLDEKLATSCQEQNQETRCARLAEEKRLTPREGEVLLLLARGRNAAVIARELVISPYTAKTHIYRIMKKLDVRSQQDLIDVIDGM